jgi:serine/threonine-protein kinase
MEYLTIVASAAASASAAALVGPFIFVPILAIGNVTAFLLVRNRTRATLIVALGCLTVLLPLLLDELGVFPPAYVFAQGTMRILPRLVELRPSSTIAELTVITLGVLVSCGVWFLHFRDQLDEAQRRLHLHDWQLRQLIPSQARQASSLPPRAAPDAT